MQTKSKNLTDKQKKKVVEKIVLASLSPTELAEKAERLRKEIIKARMEIKIGREKNVRKGFKLRKELAKVLTVLK